MKSEVNKLIDIFYESKIDYDKINKTLYKRNIDTKNEYDISMIIPVRGRSYLYEPFVRFLEKNDLSNIAVTFVEHDYNPTHFGHCRKYGYIFIPSEKNTDKFNKCLAHNIGFLYGPKAKRYLFHDLDLLIPMDFFKKIGQKVNLQPYKDRRVLYANAQLTERIINGTPLKLGLNESHPDIRPGNQGAPGGSILIDRGSFIEIGGYDPEYFSGYSVEDQFFYDKLSLFYSIETLSSVELIHLNHETGYAVVDQEDRIIFDRWRALYKTHQKYLVLAKAGLFKKYI